MPQGECQQHQREGMVAQDDCSSGQEASDGCWEATEHAMQVLESFWT